MELVAGLFTIHVGATALTPIPVQEIRGSIPSMKKGIVTISSLHIRYQVTNMSPSCDDNFITTAITTLITIAAASSAR